MNTVTNQYKKVLIFNGSPHKNGNSKKLLDNLLNELDCNFLIDVINVYKTEVSPCIDCGICKNGPCPFNQKDDMNMILKKIEDNDIIICQTPIYFNSVPSKFKAIFDRMQQLFLKRSLENKSVFSSKKLGILVSSAGSKDEFAQLSLEAMFKMFFRLIDAQFIEHIYVNNTDNNLDLSISNDKILKIKNSIN